MLKSKLLQILTLKIYRKRLLIILSVVVFVYFYLNEQSKVTDSPAPITSDYLAVHDCGVVLTGSSGRIREAFEVLNQKKIKRLVVSGVYKDTKLNEIFPQLPFYADIDPNTIVLEKISGSTFGNAVQTLQVFEALKCENLLLMTSDLHMYRALKMFKAVFPENVQISTYRITNPTREISFFDVAVESIKSLFYNFIYPIAPHI